MKRTRDTSARLSILLVSRGVFHVEKGLLGGAELFVVRTAEQLAKLGHSVHLVTDCSIEKQQELNEQGVTVHQVGMPSFLIKMSLNLGFWAWLGLHLLGNILAAWSAFRCIRAERIDIAHCHGSLSSLILGFLAPGLPRVYTLHDAGPWLGEYERFYERWLRKLLFQMLDVAALNGCTHGTVVFQAMKDHLVGRWNVSADSMSVVHPGVDVETHSPSGQNHQRKTYLFVGGLIRRKGVDVVIDLARSDPGLKFQMVGGGLERKWLEAAISNSGLQNQVQLCGVVSNEHLPDLYRNAVALILPSRSEGLPLTVLEALSCGTPVVAYDVGGVGDIVQDRWNGFVVKRGDLAGLASALKQLGDDSSLRTAMGNNARASVKGHFSWSRVAAEFQEIYLRVQVPAAYPVRETSRMASRFD